VTHPKKPAEPKKRVGRPPLPADARKDVNLTFRARGDMREWLRSAAETSGRSVSEEIEQVLEAHRTNQDIVLRVLGGKHASDVVTPLLLFLSQLDRAEFAWRENPELAGKVKEAAQTILDAALTKRVIPNTEYGSLFDKSLPHDEPRNRIAGVAIAVMEIFELAEPLPNRLLATPLRGNKNGA